jgi:hypothetical protein
MPICFAIMVIFQKNFIFLKMAIIWLQLTEISLKFESSSQKLFEFNLLKIVDSKGEYSWSIIQEEQEYIGLDLILWHSIGEVLP